MNHNDVLRSLRYMLKVNDAKMAEIIALSGLEVNPIVLATYLKKEDEAGFVRCPERVMAHFLDGLVIHRRGKDDSRPAQPVELPVTNNTILKKLRVAFELKLFCTVRCVLVVMPLARLMCAWNVLSANHAQ